MSSLTPCFTLVLLYVLAKLDVAQSLTCSSNKFTRNRVYEHCNDLPHLKSYLHWTYNPAKSTLSLAFLAPPAKPSGWIAWAINPNRTGMVGSQALIAFREANGSMAVKTFKVYSYKMVKQEKIAYPVSDMEAEYENGVITIFAKIVLPKNMKTFNQVWQVGSSVMDGMPMMHQMQPANLNSKGEVDLLNGKSASNNGENSNLQQKRLHGILNAFSWGILFPLGIMVARYLRTVESAEAFWFYLHVGCQFCSYAIGVGGWATGLKLGAESKGIQFTSHRIIGMILFSVSTLQMFAMFLRPSRDHKYRTYWNVYHHGIGYTILVLGIFNVFKGLEMLNPARIWKISYVLLLVVLGIIALALEALTWMLFLKKKANKKKSTKPYDGFNGSNEKQQPLAS